MEAEDWEMGQLEVIHPHLTRGGQFTPTCTPRYTQTSIRSFKGTVSPGFPEINRKLKFTISIFSWGLITLTKGLGKFGLWKGTVQQKMRDVKVYVD